MVLFIYFLERGEGREKEKEGYVSVWLPPTGDQAHNPDLFPDWEELNQQPCGSQPTPNPLSYTSQGGI